MLREGISVRNWRKSFVNLLVVFWKSDKIKKPISISEIYHVFFFLWLLNNCSSFSTRWKWISNDSFFYQWRSVHYLSFILTSEHGNCHQTPVKLIILEHLNEVIFTKPFPSFHCEVFTRTIRLLSTQLIAMNYRKGRSKNEVNVMSAIIRPCKQFNSSWMS